MGWLVVLHATLPIPKHSTKLRLRVWTKSFKSDQDLRWLQHSILELTRRILMPGNLEKDGTPTSWFDTRDCERESQSVSLAIAHYRIEDQ